MGLGEIPPISDPLNIFCERNISTLRRIFGDRAKIDQKWRFFTLKMAIFDFILALAPIILFKGEKFLSQKMCAMVEIGYINSLLEEFFETQRKQKLKRYFLHL